MIRNQVVTRGESVAQSQPVAREIPKPTDPMGWEAVWSVPGIVYPQASAVFVTPISGTVARVVVAFDQAPTGGTHRIELFKAGASVWSLVVPSASNPYVAPSPPSSPTVADTTLWQVRCTSVGAGSPSFMSVAVRFA